MTTHSTEQKEWLQVRNDAKAAKGNAAMRLNNMALTIDGEMCIGMSYSNEWRRYSCSYMQIDGKRINEPSRWDSQGISLEGRSDLNMGTVQDGVRKI